MAGLDRSVAYLDEKFARLPDNDESREVQKAVDEAVSALLGSVATSDARFEYQLEPSGSFTEGTKIIQADEFDFMVDLTRLAGFCDLVYMKKRSRLVLVRISSSDGGNPLNSWSEFCEEHSDVIDPITGTSTNNGPILCLNGSKLKQRFYSLLREAFKSVTWPSHLKFLSSTGFGFDKMGLPGATQFAASEKLDFRWKDTLNVSVDLTLAIKCKGWPLLTGMFESSIGKDHPALVIKNETKSSGFHVVPKVGPIWRISWARAETVLLKHIFCQNSEAVVSYRVAKLIKETHFVEVMERFNTSSPLSICETSSLKHLLFVLWVSAADFTTKSCGEILMDLLKMLSDGLKAGFCPHVFADLSTMKSGPLLQYLALALEKCIGNLRTMQATEISQVPKACEDFFREKIPVVFPSPPKKLSSYKITKL